MCVGGGGGGGTQQGQGGDVVMRMGTQLRH